MRYEIAICQRSALNIAQVRDSHSQLALLCMPLLLRWAPGGEGHAS